MSYFIIAFHKYANFNGRSSRSEYWYFILFFFIGIILLTILDSILGLYNDENNIGIISSIFILLCFIPSISVAVRRLHDIGKSGWWYLIILIPIVGLIATIYFGITDSEVGNNQYGANPKL